MATNHDIEERKIIKYTYLLTKAHVVEVHQLQTATSELTTLPLHYRLHPLSFLNSLFPSLPINVTLIIPSSPPPHQWSCPRLAPHHVEQPVLPLGRHPPHPL